jgi:hypothetical protein
MMAMMRKPLIVALEAVWIIALNSVAAASGAGQ